jgi:hypothetical protein
MLLKAVKGNKVKIDRQHFLRAAQNCTKIFPKISKRIKELKITQIIGDVLSSP